MAIERASYMGPRIRRLRRELGLTQQDMASDLEVSVSYISLIEGNQRPLTADMLLRLARTYRLDMSDFAGDGGAESTERLQAAIRDPLFADIDMPAIQTADVATNYPGFAEAFLRLLTAYREGQYALADSHTEAGTELRDDAVRAVQQFLAAHRNSFPTLDDAAEALAERIASHANLAAYFAERHQLRVRPMPPDFMGGMIRRHDPHHAAIFLDDTLDSASRSFLLFVQVAYLELGSLIDALLQSATFASDDGRRLARRALANYAAAAIQMPYAAFAQAVEHKHYDIEALARQFGASFEQVAHRLTTLQKPGMERVPFFFLRIDAAGNVSKRLDGAGFPFAGHGGGCPLWSVHSAFRTPGKVLTQWVELPDGQRFFSIARMVVAGGGSYAAPRVERAIALACAAEHADRLVYANDMPNSAQSTPIGISCPLCHREHCPARSAPPIGRQLLPDDYHRRRAPFGFADN